MTLNPRRDALREVAAAVRQSHLHGVQPEILALPRCGNVCLATIGMLNHR